MVLKNPRPKVWRTAHGDLSDEEWALIAATAHANGLPLYTRNPGDFDGLGRLIEIIGV